MKEITFQAKHYTISAYVRDFLWVNLQKNKVYLQIILIMGFLTFVNEGFAQTYKDEIRQVKNLDYVSSQDPIDLVWINSSLQANNSAYSEGMSTLQRIIFENLPPAVGNEHTLRIRIQTLKGGKHAYDFITSWEQSMNVAQTILPPGFISLPDPGSDASHPVYTYTEYEDLACGPNITSTAEIACVAADLSGNEQYLPVVQDEIPNPNVDSGLDSSTRAAIISAYESVYGDRTVKVKGDMPFTGNAGDPNSRVTFAGFDGEYMFYDISWVSASSSIVIEFGAQIAAGFSPTGVYSKNIGYSVPADGIVGYGPGRGASNVSGAPYHVKFTAFLTDFVDGKAPTLGSQDNQLMADGVRLIPFCDLQGQQSFCLDEVSGSVTYDGNATNLEGASYSWSFKTGTNTSNATFDGPIDESTVDVNPGDQAGSYILVFRVTNDSGLFAECEITANVGASTANAGSDDSVCYDDGTNQMTLNGSASGGTAPYTYSWSGDTTYLSATNVAGPTHDNAPVGTYNLTLTVTDDNGCQDTDTVTLVVDPNPTANAGSDDSVCYDDGTNQMTLNGSASGGTAPYTYSWSGDTTYLSATNVAGPTHDNAPVGTYNLTLTVTDDNGCQDTDTVTLVVDPNPTFTTDEPQLTCFGEAPSIAVTSDTSGLEFKLEEKALADGTFADYTGPFTDLKYDTDYVLTARDKTTGCETEYEFKTDIQIDIPAIVQLTINSPTCGSYDGSTYFGSIQIDNHIPGYLYAVVDQSTFVDIESVPVSAYMNYDGTSGLISGVAVGEYYVIAKSPDGCLSAIAPAILLTPDCLTCETAFAKDSDSADGKDSSYCFIDDNVPNYENSLTEERWGWTNEYTQAEYTTWTESDPLVLDLYAAAGQCDISKGALAGYVEVYFVPNGKAPGAGTFVVEYISNETELGWLIEGAQFYIGEDPYPKNGKGKNADDYTVAPGKYPFTIDTDATNHIMLDSLECDGVDKIYIIAHAEVCTANSTTYQDKLWDEAQTEYFNINIKNNSIIYAEPTKGGKTQVSSTSTSSIESSEPLFSIAPVPFRDVLNVGYLFDYTSDVTIQIFDLNGRLLKTYTDTAVNSNSVSTFNVDFRTKSNQIYIVRMTTDREVYTTKIIAAK
ncbi:PKD domain-containing protein [Christiangramia sediminis]|uniref:T9SS type A sorting domain-containing protein n=1 Tax=Christiangramia sediminis TaxID=2881336 RepID=A0A9X1LJ38_9FLAO|nr:PKD domain-containing protein [Christiangramia sediminis]MCB7481284.1 T9SS type A sorting domain-containing protein [Christiangramia sediminis]